MILIHMIRQMNLIISSITSDAWSRTHSFGDEWLDSDISTQSGQDTNICPSDGDCIDAALSFCNDALKIFTI